MKNIGEIIIRIANYEQGFINIRKAFSDLIDKNGNRITIELEDGPTLTARIDRTTNNNGTPRLYMGGEYKEWVQRNYAKGDNMRFEIINKNQMKLFKD